MSPQRACSEQGLYHAIRGEQQTKGEISEMPSQAVTLEPLVQGECVVATIRLLGRTEHAHR